MSNDVQPTKEAAIEQPQRTGVLQKIASISANISADETLNKWFLRIWTAVGAILLVGVTIYLLNVLALPVSMLIWTLVFVFMLRPLVGGMSARGMNRGLATTLAYVIMFIALGIIAFLMFSPMFGLPEQFRNLAEGIPEFARNLTGWLNEQYARYAEWFDNETVKSFLENAANSLSSWASGAASGAASAVVDFGAGIANTFMAVGFALVIAFWFLLELPALRNEAKRLLNPKYYEDARFFHITFTRIMGGYIKGMIVQCVLIGVACGILFGVIGVPNAPALGVITGVLNIIPIVGPWLGGAVAAITAVFVSPLTAVIAVVGAVIIQQVVYTFISPRIMASSVDVHPALTLIAMMFGSAIGAAMSGLLGSLVGMLLAIPAVAVMKSCFIYFFEKRTGRLAIGSEGMFFKGTPYTDEEGSVHPLQDATSSYEPVKSKDGLIARFRERRSEKKAKKSKD